MADFLSAVSGQWEGRTVHTPAGQFSYDIRFAAEDGCTAGVANPGGTQHHWKFCPVDDGLELEFLSNFGGNDSPLRLQMQGIEDGALRFQSQKPAFLKVHARVEGDCMRLQVLHHDRLHVEIHLRRPVAGTVACPWSAPAAPVPEGPDGA